MNTINNEKAMKKSKSQICTSLMRLLKTTPYRKISVSRVCSSAGVSRTAFYTNFRSMDDVVLYKLTQMEKNYNKQYSADDDIRMRFAGLYTWIRGDRDFDLMFVKNNLFYIFEEQIRTGYLSYMDTQTGQNLEGFQREYLPEYLSATVVSLLRKWAETGYREPPERMADITARLLEGYQKLLPMPTVSEAYKKIQDSPSGLLNNLESQADSVSDILNNVPVGVCVLFMPDDTHQEIWFANKQQMRLINPNTTTPETVPPKFSKLRSGYYMNAFSGVHPDDIQRALEAFKEGFHQKQFKIPPIRLKIDNGNYIWVATGIGMSEEFIKHMYEPFAQEKRSEHVQMPGTGLGLSIVRRYVDLLGGNINVESRLHVGTRWEVTLPVTILKNGLEGKPKSERLEILKGRRVLLCEDNQMNTEIASRLLQDKGMLVETAENGALGLAKFSASADGYYDAVLMDIRMSDMNGYEATRQIRALKRQDAPIIPIIAMTADAFEESIREAKEAGMSAYVTKPIESFRMYNVLQQCIEKIMRH